jgi:hypothetical protein
VREPGNTLRSFEQLRSGGQIRLEIGEEFEFLVTDIISPSGNWSVEELASPVCTVVRMWKSTENTIGVGTTHHWHLRAVRVGKAPLRARMGADNPYYPIDLTVIVRSPGLFSSLLRKAWWRQE